MDLLTLNQFPNVAANAPATLVTEELRGFSVHALILEQGGTAFTKAQIDNFRTTIGGKDLFDNITGTVLQNQNTYDGLTSTTNFLAFFFGDPMANTVRGKHLGDLDLSIYDSPLEIQVDIGGATAPTLKAHALVGPPKLAMPYGYSEAEAMMVRALIRSQLQPTAAVTRKSFGIGLGSETGARLRRIHFHHANLTSVELKKNSIIKHDDISIALNDFVQEEYGRVASGATHYVLDRIFDGNQGEAEATVDRNGRPHPLQVNLTTSGADTIETYADVITAPGLI